MKIQHYFMILLCMIALSGCSNGSSNSVSLDATGKHAAGWAVAATGGSHPLSYLTAPDKCSECHGTDLKGGVSRVSCFSAERNGITCHAQGPVGHPAGWNAPAAHGVHAKAAVIGVDGMAFCTHCHGVDYRGAGVAQKDCLRCHTTAPHPPKPWFGSTYTHKNTDTSNAPACATCHTGRRNLSAAGLAALPATAIIGTTGCFNNTLCHGVMGHSSDPQPWVLPSNHGARAKQDPSAAGNSSFAVCQLCHGTGFTTVLSGSSCISCHGLAAPHPSALHWREVASVAVPTTHTNTGVNNARVCSTCHNAATANLAAPYLTRFANAPAGSFKAGTPDCFSASMCHGDVRKTANCDACHSVAATTPFKSMAGATAPTDTIVGAHVKHLSATIGNPVACSECHTVPTSPAAAGIHRNSVNDIVFGTLAKTGGLVPTYTAATGICGNTYCHGTSLNGGSNKSPRWSDTAYNAGCATCHGYPPLTTRSGATHSTSTTCNSCHTHVNASNTGFITATLHINGSVEASGGAHGFPNPGSLHRGATPSSCQGCHNISATTGVYPVPAGTAPVCAGCHVLTRFVGCTDCHGSAASGQPSGSVFPNRAGKHGDHTAIMANCDYCHFGGGTGAAAHGHSNRILKTVRDVKIAKNPARYTPADTITITQNPATGAVNCSGSCHMGGNTRSHGDNW